MSRFDKSQRFPLTKFDRILGEVQEERGLKEGEYSQTAAGALRILSTIASEKRELGSSELARKLGLSNGAVQRLIRALERELFLQKNPETRKYRIGIRAFQVGQLYLPGRILGGVAEEAIHEMVIESGNTCYISILQSHQMVVLSSIEGTGLLRLVMPVGTRMSLHGTANGLAALSTFSSDELLDYARRRSLSQTRINELVKELKDTRSKGYSIIRGAVPGIIAIASPIAESSKQLSAVISMAFPEGHASEAEIVKWGGRLIKTAARIARDLRVSSK
jgi:DNA-binding IclR family transcriptional regulator